MSDPKSERILVEVLNGALRVVRGQHVITHFRSRKHASLLAYLACHGPGKRHSRGAVAELFWPGSGTAAAKASLCEAISSLRTQIEPLGIARGSILETDRATIGLSRAVETDLENISVLLARAEQAGATGDLQTAVDMRLRAIQLAPNTLLPDLSEDWVLYVHARLSSQIAEAHCCLAAHFLRTGNRRLATAHARNASALDADCAGLSHELEALLEDSDFEPRRAAPATDLAQRRDAPRLISVATAQPSNWSTTVGQVRDERRLVSARSRREARTRASARSVAILAPATRLFGREREREILRSMLADKSIRLVTLAGPGGTGKTRLALAAAHDRAKADSRIAIFYVPLATISDASRLHDHLLTAILGYAHGVTADDAGIGEAREALRRALNAAGGRVLLVLDNLEQVAEPAGDLIAFLIAYVPGLTCLVTSRQLLLRSGEHWFPVEPLPIPPQGHEIAETELEEDVDAWPSIALFVDRARQAAPNFRLTPTTASAIAALVTKLEGIPLAIELAAARSLLFTPAQMLERVSARRFDLLVDRQAERRSQLREGANQADVAVEARHSSLFAAMAWSYSLLPDDAKKLLASLSIFRGGCTAAAVLAVLGPGNGASNPQATGGLPAGLPADSDVADLLEQLCRASLIQTEAPSDNDGEIRFTLLETIREFASTKLPQERAAELLVHHALYFAELVEMAEPHLQDGDAILWLEQIDRDYANLCVALDWASSTPTSEAARLGIRIATALHRYWLVRSALREGRRRLQTALAHPCADAWDDATEARARNRAGVLAMTDGDSDAAEARYRETLALRKALNDRAGMASLYNNLAILATGKKCFAEARKLYMDSLEIFRALRDVGNVAKTLGNLGGIDILTGDLKSAREFLTESVLLAQSLGDGRGAAIRRRNLGIVAYQEGDWRAAERQFFDTLGQLLSLGDERGCAYSLLCLGLTSYKTGQYRRSLRLLRTGLAGYSAFGQPIPEFALAETTQLSVSGFLPHQTPVAPGSAAAAAAIHAITVLTQIIIEGWGDSDQSDGRSARAVPPLAPTLAAS